MSRVPYVTATDIDPEYRELIVSSLQPGKTLNVYSAVGNNERVLEGLRGFLGALWNHSGLGDRQREIVILTTASEIAQPYEWHQHVAIATDAGLTTEEIAAIARDDRSVFPTTEQALIAYTRAVVQGRVTESLHKGVAEEFDEDAMVGIAATAAGYLALGRVIDAFDIEIEAGDEFVGWDLEG
ncbi:carboxymuconolactone decarboxylase family protein [Natrinema longum]|uniref:carboxymuconolactone decarboxylase family protein n=1 Tax=Natrinema longum TaxID=370324 RepID=UPI001CCC28BE|nr:carboxymuconolactone decarboxylase family protein [Natrinema longum]MBZ6496793.1 carboxymuconolactone decarboxylase family protein [Natrinema longum]